MFDAETDKGVGNVAQRTLSRRTAWVRDKGYRCASVQQLTLLKPNLTFSKHTLLLSFNNIWAWIISQQAEGYRTELVGSYLRLSISEENSWVFLFKKKTQDPKQFIQCYPLYLLISKTFCTLDYILIRARMKNYYWTFLTSTYRIKIPLGIESQWSRVRKNINSEKLSNFLRNFFDSGSLSWNMWPPSLK